MAAELDADYWAHFDYLDELYASDIADMKVEGEMALEDIKEQDEIDAYAVTDEVRTEWVTLAAAEAATKAESDRLNAEAAADPDFPF